MILNNMKEKEDNNADVVYEIITIYRLDGSIEPLVRKIK